MAEKKVVLITGVSSGIGQATARLLTQRNFIIQETFGLAICARYVIIFLVSLARAGAVTEFTKPHGRAILE